MKMFYIYLIFILYLSNQITTNSDVDSFIKVQLSNSSFSQLKCVSHEKYLEFECAQNCSSFGNRCTGFYITSSGCFLCNNTRLYTIQDGYIITSTDPTIYVRPKMIKLHIYIPIFIQPILWIVSFNNCVARQLELGEIWDNDGYDFLMKNVLVKPGYRFFIGAKQNMSLISEPGKGWYWHKSKLPVELKMWVGGQPNDYGTTESQVEINPNGLTNTVNVLLGGYVCQTYQDLV